MFRLFCTIFSAVLMLLALPNVMAVPISPPIPLGSGITASDMAFLNQSMNPNQLKILNYCMASNMVKNKTPMQAYVDCRKLAYSTEMNARTSEQLDKLLRKLMDARP